MGTAGDWDVAQPPLSVSLFFFASGEGGGVREASVRACVMRGQPAVSNGHPCSQPSPSRTASRLEYMMRRVNTTSAPGRLFSRSGEIRPGTCSDQCDLEPAHTFRDRLPPTARDLLCSTYWSEDLGGPTLVSFRRGHDHVHQTSLSLGLPKAVRRNAVRARHPATRSATGVHDAMSRAG